MPLLPILDNPAETARSEGLMMTSEATYSGRAKEILFAEDQDVDEWRRLMNFPESAVRQSLTTFATTMKPVFSY